MVLHGTLRKTRLLRYAGNRRLGIANLSQQSYGRVAHTREREPFQLLQSLFRSHTFPLLKPKRYHKKTLRLAFYSASFKVLGNFA